MLEYPAGSGQSSGIRLFFRNSIVFTPNLVPARIIVVIHHEIIPCRPHAPPSISPCYLTLPHITSHYLTLPHITSHYLTLPHITSHYLTLPHITSHYLTLPHITSHYLTLPHTTSHYLTPPHTTSHYLTLPHTILDVVPAITILTAHPHPHNGWLHTAALLLLLPAGIP